jgi:YD repeat-containing protein
MRLSKILKYLFGVYLIGNVFSVAAETIPLIPLYEYRIAWSGNIGTHEASWQSYCQTAALYVLSTQLTINATPSHLFSTASLYSCTESFNSYSAAILFSYKPINGIVYPPVFSPINNTFPSRLVQGCPDSFTIQGDSCYRQDCLAPATRLADNTCGVFPKSLGPTLCSNSTSHPISIESGNKWLSEIDYWDKLANDGFSFNRTYNSTKTLNRSQLSSGWVHSSYAKISFSINKVILERPTGREFTFSFINNAWVSDLDITSKLTELKNSSNVRTGWTYTSESSDEIETYNVDGKLVSFSNRAGLTKNIIYSCMPVSSSCPIATSGLIAPIAGLIVKVTDSLGRSLHFTYDNLNRIKTMTNPAGGVYQYGYDANNNLAFVTYPDLKVKTYHYGEVGHVAATPAAGVVNANLLTGITDENGHRYANYYYDAQGRAFQESLAGGADATDLVYNTDVAGNPISTVVTDARQNQRTHNFTTVLGVVKSTGQSQPAGSGCAAAASELTYDVNGNVKTRIDFKGNKTTYDYLLSRNLETSRTEGLTSDDVATLETRTITTSWHDTWRLPHIISEYSGKVATGTPLKRTTYLYDDKGNITTYTIEDPVRGLSRTTTTSYVYSTAVPGLVLEKTVDGPLPTDVDQTRYYYYPHDATCTASNADPIVDPITGTSPPNLGCRGQLSQVIQSSGFMTVYNRYNHHGQVEEWTDSNQVLYTQSYDLRQRLIRSTVENEQTFFTYDDAGQLKKTTFPDGSELNYTYDDAHRLTEISNAMGDKVKYTLDDNGNPEIEEMFDSSGTLTKSITRQFDALNRAQTVTGE